VLRRRSELELDTQPGEIVRGPERASVGVPGACQQLLGERRTIVWQVGLASDESETAVEALLTQSLAGAKAREAGSHRHDGPEGIGHDDEATPARQGAIAHGDVSR
jgi:hypothetical protein